MNTPVTPDLYNMPMEELHALANAPVVEPVVEPVVPVTEQPRDEAGRFVTPAPVAPVVAPTPVVPQVYRRVIDLGDGSGVQVFEASSPDLLIDKLADAQTHATRKIRQMTQAQKETPVVTKKKLTPDEEWVENQKWQVDPRAAARELFHEELNNDPRITAAEKIIRERENAVAANTWVASTPDYFGNDYNGRKMTDYINRFCDGAQTPENLTKAFADLNGAGLLQTKPADTPAPPTPAPVVTAPSPARRSSGLSARAAGLAPTVNVDHTVEDMYSMPLEKLEELARKQARGQ